MPREDNKRLKYNHKEKSMKVPFIIYADLESLLEIMSTCHNNPKKSSTTKINKYTLVVIHCSQIVHSIQQKLNLIIKEAKIV